MTEKEKKRLEELRHKKNRTKEELEELNALRKKLHQATFNTPASEKSKKQAEEKGRDTSLKMALASLGITSAPDYQSFGEGYRQAVDRQTLDRIEELELLKLAIDASLTGMEFMSGLYGLGRGVSSANRYLANKAFLKGLLSGTKAAKARLLNLAVNKGLTAMSSVGFVSDVGQAATSEGPWYGDYVNDAELLGDGAGIIGGLNIVRNTPFFGKHRGAIDSVLDGMGYTAAAYDVVHDGRLILDLMATSPVEELLNLNARGGRLFGQGGSEDDVDWDAIRAEVLGLAAPRAEADNTLVAPVLVTPLRTGPKVLPEVEVTAPIGNAYKNLKAKYILDGFGEYAAAIKALNDLGMSAEDATRVEHPILTTVGDALKAGAEGTLLAASYVDPVIGGIGELGVGAYETLMGRGDLGLSRMAMASIPGVSSTITGMNQTAGDLFNLGTASYFGSEAATDIYENGLNPLNAAALGLSIMPMAGTAKAEAWRLARTYGPLAWRTAWYNNLTPGAYSAKASWHPKGKIKGEAVLALKDYFSGKGTELNPKWWDLFQREDLWANYPKGKKYTSLEAELRREAFQLYLGMPHESKYIIPTGEVDANGIPLYTIALDKLPKDLILEYVLRILSGNMTRPDRPGANTGTTGDFANIGGNARYENQVDLANNIFRIIQLDVWDVQPLQDPNRIAPSMPEKLRDMMFDSYKDEKGNVKYKHKKWLEPFKDMELGVITGGQPFNVTSTIEGQFMDTYPVKETWTAQKIQEVRRLIKEEYQRDLLDSWSEFYDEGMSEEALQELWLNDLAAASAQAEEMAASLSDLDIIQLRSTPYSPEEYANSTGIFNYPTNWLPQYAKANGGYLFAEGGFSDDVPNTSLEVIPNGEEAMYAESIPQEGIQFNLPTNSNTNIRVENINDDIINDLNSHIDLSGITVQNISETKSLRNKLRQLKKRRNKGGMSEEETRELDSRIELLEKAFMELSLVSSISNETIAPTPSRIAEMIKGQEHSRFQDIPNPELDGKGIETPRPTFRNYDKGGKLSSPMEILYLDTLDTMNGGTPRGIFVDTVNDTMMGRTKAKGGHLFGEEGQMELAPSNFTNWTEDNWKYYNLGYDDLYKNVNWSALNNNLLFHVKDINDVDNILASNNSTFMNPSTIQWLGNMELLDMATGLGLKDYNIDNPIEASALPDTPEAKAFLEALERYRSSIDLANRLAPTMLNAADNHLKTVWTLNKETGKMVPKQRTKGCLESALDFGYKMFMYGVPHMRDIYSGFNLADYKNGIYQIPERNGISNTYSKSGSLSSWNYARALSDAGYGQIVNLGEDIDYTQFPVGTVFNGGHHTSGRLIDPSYQRDENGREYPSHSYMLAGFITDDNGRVKPLLYDYGELGVDLVIYKGQVQPTYAFIPNGYEHLTAVNLIPRYNEYYNSIHTPPDPSLYSLQNANEATDASLAYLDAINPEELVALNERYGITNAADVLQRLVGIASLESEMGYTLDSSSVWNPFGGMIFDNPFYSGRDYDTWASTYRWMQHSMPDGMKTFVKNMTRPTTPDTDEEIDAKLLKYNKKYDDTPAWKHEVDIYNQLASEGKFEGLSRGQIAALVAEKYNAARDAWVDEDWWNRSKDNYGKRAPNIRTASQENATNSHGIFQMKQWPDNIEYDKEGNEIGRSNVDDAYTGESEFLKGYNRFGFLMKQLRAAYPDLTEDELVDAATIAWNAPSKLKDREFVDFYIKNRNLKDSYLEAVKLHLETLYRDRFRGTKGNYGEGYYRGDNHWYQRVGNWLGTVGLAEGGHLYSGKQPGTSLIRIRPTDEVQYVGNTEDQNGVYDPTYVLPNVSVFNVTDTLPFRTAADLTPNDNIGTPQGINVTDPDLEAAASGAERYSEMMTPMDFMPFVGDAQDVAGVGIDAAEGNYGMAAMGLGMMAVPNAIEKPLRWVGRKVKPAARRLMTSIGDFVSGTPSAKEEVKETMELILLKSSHGNMPIGHVSDAYNITAEIPELLKEDYQKVMKKVEKGEKLTNAEEKVLSDYNAFMSADNHYRPGYQTTNPYELPLGVAPENPRSLTAIALDLNKPYKADGSLADGWIMKDGKPVFDYDAWLKLLDPDSYDFVNVAGNTELNPLSYALYLQKLKGLAAQGKVLLHPVRNADGSYFMLRLNNWNASKPEPHYTTEVTVNPDGTKTRTKVNDRDLTVEEKMDKQDRAMRSDSALVLSMRGIMGLPDLPLPARVTGTAGVVDDLFMFPAIGATRIGADGLPIEPVIEHTPKPSRRRSGTRFRANGGYLYANGGEPQYTQSLSTIELNNINQAKYRGITREVIYKDGGPIARLRKELAQSKKDYDTTVKTIDGFRDIITYNLGSIYSGSLKV